jgi:signal transduction histidine kinase
MARSRATAPTRPLIALWASALLTTAGFFAATAFAERSETGIDQAAETIAEDSAPRSDGPSARRPREAAPPPVARRGEEARLAGRITRIHRRGVWVAWALDGASAILAIAMTLLAGRVARRSAQVLASRAEELEAFAGRMAHDVLSPLGTVSLATAVVRTRSPDPVARDALARIDRSLVHVRRVVEALLGFARAGARPEPGASAEAAPAIDAVLDQVRAEAAAARVQLRREPVEPCRVACAEGVLRSLLWNLASNAVKHMGDSPVRTVTIRVRPLADLLMFEVEDTGPGLPPGGERCAFDPFVRLGHPRAPGVGLGLATVRKLAEAHGGAAGVRPAATGGSIFWFDLPRRR